MTPKTRRTLYILCRVGVWVTCVVSILLLFGCGGGADLRFYGGLSGLEHHRATRGWTSSLEVRPVSTCPTPRRRVHFPRSYVPHHPYHHHRSEP